MFIIEMFIDDHNLWVFFYNRHTSNYTPSRIEASVMNKIEVDTELSRMYGLFGDDWTWKVKRVK